MLVAPQHLVMVAYAYRYRLFGTAPSVGAHFIDVLVIQSLLTGFHGRMLVAPFSLGVPFRRRTGIP